MNPYENLPDSSFWRLAVAQKDLFDISDLWDPKYNILPQHKIATYGSCFAQHIGRSLKRRGYSWLSTEPPPHGMSEANARKFNYDIFTCRTGNIYTTSLLRQWVEWGLGSETCPSEVWEKDGRYYDPFRPSIEPGGFVSVDELLRSRNQTIGSFLASISRADFFVFTLGLTESWRNRGLAYEYPMCPGTAAGDYEERHHVFCKQQFEEVRANLVSAIKQIKTLNKRIRFILTVSPVPLTATKSTNHVLVATMESKSILRAVAGQVAENRKDVDYFPSYEMINSPVFRGIFFGPNQRSVTERGVQFVMDSFFDSLTRKFGAPNAAKSGVEKSDEALVCEEEILSSFRN